MQVSGRTPEALIWWLGCEPCDPQTPCQPGHLPRPLKASPWQGNSPELLLQPVYALVRAGPPALLPLRSTEAKQEEGLATGSPSPATGSLTFDLSSLS